MNAKKQIIGFTFLLLFLNSCSTDQNPLAYQTDTHGRGKKMILIEESFRKLFDTSIYTFESQYPKADIIPNYMAETEIIDAFFQNKSKTIVISRDFTAEEKKALKSRKVEVRSDKIAIDAIAIIVNPANKDTTLTIAQLRDIVSGKTQKWKSLGSKINLVYDQKNSANFNYMRAYFGEENMSKELFAANSNEEVINYVKKNPNAIGVIGVNWISDQDDFDVKYFLDGIKVVGLAKDDKSEFYQPYSGYIHTKEYPLIRDIWMINKGSKSGLNTGFVLFMTGDIGQTIIQKASLVPAKNPVRLIQMIEEK